jgi:GH18 family chitinase
MSPDILTAEVVAHETGHWFQQNHSQRQNCCVYTAGKASGLDWAHFALDGSHPANVLIGLEQYKNGSRQKTPLDKMACSSTTPKATTTTVKGVTPPMPVYNVGDTSDFTPNPTSASTLTVWNLQYELMDWTPNFTLADPTQWHFDPANLNALCAQNPCPPAYSGTNVCTPTN